MSALSEKLRKHTDENYTTPLPPIDGPRNEYEWWLLQNGYGRCETISLEEAKRRWAAPTRLRG